MEASLILKIIMLVQDYGVALGLEGLLGIKTGSVKLIIKKSKNYSILVKPTRLAQSLQNCVRLNSNMNDAQD